MRPGFWLGMSTTLYLRQIGGSGGTRLCVDAARRHADDLPDLLKPPVAPPRLASSAPAFAIMVDDH